MKHKFKEGEKEAVASLLGIEPQMLPDELDLENDEEDEDDEEDEEDEEESEDDEESDDDDSEDDESEDEEEEDDSVEEDVEHIKLLDEWRKDYSEHMPFSEFLKNRGK